MRKFWLLFAQATTIGLSMLFIVHTLKPGLLPNAARNGVVTLYENTPDSGSKIPAAGFSAAAKKVMPAVVNIFTTSTVKVPANPFKDDPRFRFFFGDPGDNGATEQNSSLARRHRQP